MGKIALLCFICVCFVEIVQLTPVPYRTLSKKELNDIALECIAQTNIDRAVIEKVLKTQILPKDDKKYKDFLACSYKKQGYMSDDGKMQYDNIFQFLSRFYNVSEFSKNLETCKEINEDDHGEMCFQHLDCILAGLRKTEEEREEEITDNNI